MTLAIFQNMLVLSIALMWIGIWAEGWGPMQR